MLLVLALGAILATLVALLAGTAREAQATFPGTNARIAFDSNRTTGTGVDNPTGDSEIFTINPDGTGLKQLTHNTVDDPSPPSPPTAQDRLHEPGRPPQLRGRLRGLPHERLGRLGHRQTSQKASVDDFSPVFSPDGTKIAYESRVSKPPTPRATPRST